METLRRREVLLMHWLITSMGFAALIWHQLGLLEASTTRWLESNVAVEWRSYSHIDAAPIDRLRHKNTLWTCHLSPSSSLFHYFDDAMFYYFINLNNATCYCSPWLCFDDSDDISVFTRIPSITGFFFPAETKPTYKSTHPHRILVWYFSIEVGLTYQMEQF